MTRRKRLSTKAHSYLIAYLARASRAFRGDFQSPSCPLMPMRQAHHAEWYFPMLANRTCTRTRKRAHAHKGFKGEI